MENIIDSYITKEEELVNKVNKLKRYTNILKKYMEDPVSTCKEIANNEDIGLGEFKSLEAAMGGKFTQAKAIEQGKLVLLNWYTTLCKDVSSNGIDLDSFSRDISKSVEEQLELVYRNIDSTVINRRKDRYLTNSMTREYQTNKLDNIITAKLMEEGCSRSVLEYVYTLRELLAYIRIYDNTVLKKYWDKYILRKELITRAIDSASLPKEDIVSEVSVDNIKPEDTYIEFMQNYVMGNKVEETERLNIFTSLIDTIDRTYEDIKSTIDSFNSVTKDYIDTEHLLVTVIDKINNEVIQPYGKLEITATEYTSKLDIYYKILDAILATGLDVRHMVINNAKQLLRHIAMYYRVYNVIDEVTTAGQLVPTKSKAVSIHNEE